MMSDRIPALGIDIGRSGVKLACRTPKKQLHRTRIPKFVDYIDWGNDAEVVAGIRQWTKEENLALEDSARVVLDATGAVEFERVFTHDGLTVHLVGDVTMAALSCGIRRDGLLMICGTGAALVFFSGEAKRIMKAYGPVVGDQWGGLALGRMAVRYLLDHWVREEEPGPFESSLAGHLEITNRREYVHWLQTSENHYGELGELGGITVSMAGDGNLRARSLCEKMIGTMARAVDEALSLGRLDSPVALGLQGGMIEGSDYLRDALIKEVRKSEYEIEIRRPAAPLDVIALREAEKALEAGD